MSTIRTTRVQHPSSPSANIELNADGTVALPLTGLEDLADVSGTPVAGDKLVFDGTNWVPLAGFVYVTQIRYESDGSFVKATYPWLRAIRVRAVGAGGGGSGIASGGGAGVGGGGGAYAESFITNIAGLASTVSVTRGLGGTGSTGGGSGGIGANGGGSSFGSLVIANGGSGGAPPRVFNQYNASGGGDATAGQITVSGEAGLQGFFVSDYAVHGRGGSSVFGGNRFINAIANVAGSNNGNNGPLGVGGNGATSILGAAAATGGNGGNGIVIVDLFA